MKIKDNKYPFVVDQQYFVNMSGMLFHYILYRIGQICQTNRIGRER